MTSLQCVQSRTHCLISCSFTSGQIQHTDTNFMLFTFTCLRWLMSVHNSQCSEITPAFILTMLILWMCCVLNLCGGREICVCEGEGCICTCPNQEKIMQNERLDSCFSLAMQQIYKAIPWDWQSSNRWCLWENESVKRKIILKMPPRTKREQNKL